MDFYLGRGARLYIRESSGGIMSFSSIKDYKDRWVIDLTAGGIFSCTFGPFWNKAQRSLDRARPIHLYSHRFQDTYWKKRYTELLQQFTGFESFVVYTSGTEAVEAFLRVSWTYTGKSGLWGGLVDPDLVGTDKPLCDQFHGWTLGSRILAGRMTWHELGVYPELGSTRFGLSPEYTACMAMEPYHAPSGQFHKEDPTINRIRSLRKEFPDILFLIDEIQGGFGRCGKLCAHEYYSDLKPDFVTFGKLAGGGVPLSILCGPKDILESKTVQDHAYLHSTHSWSPLACSMGIAVIEEMMRVNIIERSYILGKKMHDWMAKLPVRVHGKGLMAGLEFKDAEEAQKVVRKCEQRRVLVVDTGRKWVKIGPCLNIEVEDLERGLKVLGEVVCETVEERELDAPPRGTVSTRPEEGGKDVESVGVQAGVDRIFDGGEDEGFQGTDDGTGKGPMETARGG